MSTLVWFRDDLRLADHAALSDAAEDPDGIVALYVLDEVSPEARPLGGAARWWLHHSLSRLRESLAALGVPLILRRGAAAEVVPAAIAECGASRVTWNRRYGAEREIDAGLKARLRAEGTGADSFHGGLLFDPTQIRTQTGGPYRVYSAFWRACLAAPAPAAPLPTPESLRCAGVQPASDDLDDWRLLPTRPDWAGEIAERWTPGEADALVRLERFLEDRAQGYARGRDFPSEEVTSELSPSLRWGEISPRTIWHRAVASGADVGGFLSELGWREFAWHTLFRHTDLHTRPLDERYAAFPWQDADDPTAADALRAWRTGRTGFPLIDAGMRELWRSGTMHNRVRMVVASFLTKNLLIDWRIGEAWFWDTLVDADAASNPFNWQWVAGCGADAAPYFRVFNPRTQQEKFDRGGSYVDRWAPESLLHPEIVDLRETRIRALAAYDTVKNAPRGGDESD